METKTNKAYIVLTIMILVIMALAIAGFVLTCAATFLIAGIPAMVFGIIRLVRIGRKKPKGPGIGQFIAVFIVAAVLVNIGCPLVSPFAWQFKFDRLYTGRYSPHRDGFIEEIPAGATDYTYEFMPSIMQGNGYTFVGFMAPSGYADELRAKLEEEGIKTVTEDLPFYLPREIREQHQGGTFYELYNNGNEHRPHLLVVMIDGDYVAYSDN